MVTDPKAKAKAKVEGKTKTLLAEPSLSGLITMSRSLSPKARAVATLLAWDMDARVTH
jgi:hypothetical protein